MDKKRRPWLFLLIAILALAIAGYFLFLDSATTVVLVRHAEKADASANTNLSAAGLSRAQALVSRVEEMGLSAAYSTDLCRTAQTAQPTAQALDLELFVQQTGSQAAGLDGCDPAIGVTMSMLPGEVSGGEGLADHILGRHRDEAVLIVGHSNTVPAVIAALGDGTFEPITITEPEYDGFFVVTVPRFFGSPRLAKSTYGN